MNKRILFLCGLILATVAFGLLGCGQSPPPITVPGGRDYFPSADGNSWTYRIARQGTTETDTGRYTFAGTTTIGGLTLQILRVETIRGTTVTTVESLLRVTDTGVYNHGTTTSPTTEGMLDLDLTMQIGRRWTTTGTDTSEVVSQESVSVPAGTYDDSFRIYYVSVIPGYNITENRWYAKNVGMVKMVSSVASGAQTETTTTELTGKNF